MKVDINRLYAKRFDKDYFLEVKFKEYTDCFDVELVGMFDGKPDCKVGHFGYNFYFRTNKGMKSEKYNSVGYIISAIKKATKSKTTLTYEYTRLINGQDVTILD